MNTTRVCVQHPRVTTTCIQLSDRFGVPSSCGSYSDQGSVASTIGGSVTTSREASPPPSALDRVVRHIESLIFDQLGPGDRLPAEGTLAEQIGVSRLTVREGVKQLAARGLVETQNGRSATVAAPNARSVGDYFRNAIRRDPNALLELLEVRLALETRNAALSAQHASPADVEAMRVAVSEMRERMDDTRAFSDADIRFHALLATSSGSAVLATLIDELSSVLRASRDRSVAGHRRRGLGLEAVVAEHEAVLESVERGDATSAMIAMRSHLENARDDLLAGLEFDPL